MSIKLRVRANWRKYKVFFIGLPIAAIFFVASIIVSWKTPTSLSIDPFTALGGSLAIIGAIWAGEYAKRTWENQKAPFLRLQWADVSVAGSEEEKIYANAKEDLRWYRALGDQEIKRLKSLAIKIEDSSLASKATQDFADMNRVMKVEANRKKYETMEKRFNEKTDLQLVNDGRGPAYNIIFKVEYLKYSNPEKKLRDVKNVTAIGADGKATRLSYIQRPKDNKGELLNDRESWLDYPIKVIVEYQDTSQAWWRTVFISSSLHFNDGFEIEELRTINYPTLKNSL